MKGFIEITECNTGRKILFNIASIKLVYGYYDGTAMVVLKVGEASKTKNRSIGFYTKESYAEVISKIKEATE